MATDSVSPKWLLDSKDNISKSKEWNTFVGELYDAIQQQLTESRVQSFNDLTDAERNLFMERAAKAINGGEAYKTLYKEVSASMDYNLNREVGRQLLEDYPINTKTDLVVDCAQDGAISLLKKWPDMKSKLHVCLNQPLPRNLRQMAWKLFLENPKVRKKYVDILAKIPRSAISPLDLEISKQCENLIHTEPTFEDLKGSIGAFYGMKAVLSYHHSLKKTKEGLDNDDYMLIVPFVVVASSKISRREPASSHIVALMVEEYFTFMDSRPGFVADSGSEVHNEEMKNFCGKVANHLETLSPVLVKSVSDMYAPEKEKIVATEAASRVVLADAVSVLARPIIHTMFVGFLNMDVVLYIWDQYVIGLDSPGFHEECLPVFMAVMLMLLQEKLKDCNDPGEVEKILRNEGPKLTVSQFQHEVNKNFYKKLFAVLNQEDKSALPVLDPTQAEYPSWNQWFENKIPQRSRPQDRRQARDEREAERQRQEQQRKENERKRQEMLIASLKEDEDNLLKEQEEVRKKDAEARNTLEDELEAERRKRLEQEAASSFEMDRLRREIEDLKRKVKSPTPSGVSVKSGERHASVATHESPLPVPQNLSPPPSRGQRNTAFGDLAKQIASSFNKVAHGEGQDRKDLDKETKKNIELHKEDVKQAEIEIFGHKLNDGEFGRLPENEKKSAADEIMEIIQNRIEERRWQGLNDGSIS